MNEFKYIIIGVVITIALIGSSVFTYSAIKENMDYYNGLDALYSAQNPVVDEAQADEPSIDDFEEMQRDSWEDSRDDYLYSMDDLDCSDFSSQEEAQDLFDQYDYDYHNLDGDGDGYACEWN